MPSELTSAVATHIELEEMDRSQVSFLSFDGDECDAIDTASAALVRRRMARPVGRAVLGVSRHPAG